MTLVGTAVPVTAGIEQAKTRSATSSRTDAAQVTDRVTKINTAAAVDLSRVPSQQRQQTIDNPTPAIPKEQIRVSVTTGEINVKGNLTPAKAAEIYQKIAKLL